MFSVSKGTKVAVVGARGRLGQPLTILLKQCPWFRELALYDLCSTKGLAHELNMIDTPCEAKAYEGESGLKCALQNAQIVLMVASAPSNDFEANGKIVSHVCKSCACCCPNALLGIATSPVNSMLPVACETYKKYNRVVDPCRMFGITTLDVVKANTYVAEVLQVQPETVDVPVIGGQSDKTTVPLLSHTKPCTELTSTEVRKITSAFQDTQCIDLRPKTTYSLSGAYAVCRFAISLAKAVTGHCVVECAYVMSNVVPTVPYLATQVEIGSAGVLRNLGIPTLTPFECSLMEKALPAIVEDIAAGEEFFSQHC